MSLQLISNEEFTSIREAQAGLAKILEKASQKGSFYRVMRNNEPLGVLLPNKTWESLVEDLEAMSSPNYLASIKKSRTSKKRYSAKQVKRTLGI